MEKDQVSAKYEAFQTADAAYMQLINEPVKTVSVAEYRRMLDVARKSRTRAYLAYAKARSEGTV